MLLSVKNKKNLIMLLIEFESYGAEPSSRSTRFEYQLYAYVLPPVV